MKKEKKVIKMDNLQIFPNRAEKNTFVTRDLVTPNLFSSVNIKVAWGKLLGGSNDEILRIILATSSKFKKYVETTRGDFIRNINNPRKFPKMSNSDWK